MPIPTTIPEPNISPNFTVEDIHKVREYHYELTKDMTFEERSAFYREGAERMKKRMAELKEQRKVV